MNFLRALSNPLTSTSQRALSDEALQHAQRPESVGQLTGGIAHDFNNLLTVIQGNLQVLQELPSLQDETAQQLAAAATRASIRGAELTDKLLAFSRRQVLQPARVDVTALLHSLADMLRRTLDQRIRISVDAPPSCPPCLADPGQLESALLNIAINARDAMPAGGACFHSALQRPKTAWTSPSPTAVVACPKRFVSVPLSLFSPPRTRDGALAWAWARCMASSSSRTGLSPSTASPAVAPR